MNVGLQCFILGVVMSLAITKTYALPYKVYDTCLDSTTEYLHESYCCSKCRPGTRLVRHCTSEEDTVCEACPDGMYSDSLNYYPNCFLCSKCEEDKELVYTKQCSRDSNAVCKCKPGWYCDSHDESCTSCKRHRTCGPGKGATTQGTSTQNVRCSVCAQGTFSNETNTQPCKPHTRCALQGRSVQIEGTSTTDTVCGPILSTVPSHVTPPHLPITTKDRTSPPEPPTKPPIPDTQTLLNITPRVISALSPDGGFIGLWLGLAVTASLVVLLIAGFCIYHRKALVKPAVHDGIEAGQCSTNSTKSSSPAENQELLADSSTDPSMSSSSDSHSQGTGVSQDCLHVEQHSVSSPVLNVSITATINCQMNPATGSYTIPVSPCVHLPEPEFPLSQEEELCMSCEQEDSKDAIQSVQESGMTKY